LHPRDILAGSIHARTANRYNDLPQGLIDAMYREGFDRLTARTRTIPPEAPPAERLRLSGLAYRENALSSPQPPTARSASSSQGSAVLPRLRADRQGRRTFVGASWAYHGIGVVDREID
jgi:hypothetical protein